MAKNDTILLDGIIDLRVEEGVPSKQADEVFEFFCFEQILKNYDLSSEEIAFGSIDGRDDGGIDGFFLFVNGQLLRDTKDFVWPKSNAHISVCVFTCKHHSTFTQAPINSLLSSIVELFDFAIEAEDFKGSYSSAIVRARQLFYQTYKKLAHVRPSLSIKYYYASRGDSPETNIQARANQVTEQTKSFFSGSEVSFEFVGSSKLIALHRHIKRFTLDLKFFEILSSAENGYILIAGLRQYADFVTDDDCTLRRYLFDSNVRDYLGRSSVNLDILATLREESSPAFWWLNNGVTILATSGRVVGKTITLTDVQIVNGLQTTESIFRHFATNGQVSRDNAVMVKVVVSQDIRLRDSIIRATNNQNVVEVPGLRATDKVQRDIEEYLEAHGWYYERRKNNFKFANMPPDRFVSPMYLATAFASLVMKNPNVAAGLRQRFMRNDAAYAFVFSEKTPLSVWLNLLEIVKRVESSLRNTNLLGRNGEATIKGWRSLVALLCVGRYLGTFDYRPEDLAKVDVSMVSDSYCQEIWGSVSHLLASVIKNSIARKKWFVVECCEAVARSFEISGVECICRQTLPGGSQPDAESVSIKRRRRAQDLSKEFIEMVHKELPPQPWPQQVHLQLAKTLKFLPSDISAAIQVLMDTGRCYHQRHGVLYDQNGQVVVPKAGGSN